LVACNYYVCCRCFRYGFRASLVSFSGLLAMVIALPFKRNSLWYFSSSCLNGVGGLWYLVVSFIFQNLHKRSESAIVRYASPYWWIPKIRAKLLTKKTKRDEHLKQSLNIKSTKSRKHSETLLTVNVRTFALWRKATINLNLFY
jgi:hypothetical protein